MSRQHTIRVKNVRGMFRVFIQVTEANGRTFGGRVITMTSSESTAMATAQRTSIETQIPMFQSTF
jgi:hypothetical protein